MLQIIQDLKSGRISVEEVPPPPLPKNGILVQNVCSLISPGTERATVQFAQASWLSKIQQRPELFKQVINNIKKEGWRATLEKIQARLSVPKALGYSSAGIVIASSTDDFHLGDRVACAGQDYASHAEIVAIPRNLACPIPEEVSFEEAAFATLGAIALHGIRQAEVRVAENVAIIGLGLIGLLALQILKAAGARVIGFDICDEALRKARELGADEVSLPVIEEAISKAMAFTQGLGVDASIITASTPSNEPVELAAAISRDRARLVILGQVRADLPRQPFYEKELEVRFSRSYGPGRYDLLYEEKGIDYPVGYVRWTENRNLVAFLELVAQGKVRVKELISHRFPVTEATKAYDYLLGKGKEEAGEKVRPLAIIIDYPEKKTPSEIKIQIPEKKPIYITKSIKTIGIIGAGHFAQSHILPALKKQTAFYLHTLADANSPLAQTMARKYGFAYAAAEAKAILDDENIEAVFIATRHDSHAALTLAALEKGKKVYVEKPLAIKEEEMEALDAFMSRNLDAYLMVGFNRRFSAAVRKIQAFFSSVRPLIIHYRVNAGPLPPRHWLHDPDQGGRFIGEAGHFIDTIKFITGKEIVCVFASPVHHLSSAYRCQDNLICLFELEDGSRASLSYFEIGDPASPKERLEIFGGGRFACLDDFRHLRLSFQGKTRNFRLSGEKGHREQILTVLQTWLKGEPSPIPYASLSNTTWVTLAAIKSLKEKRPINIEQMKLKK